MYSVVKRSPTRKSLNVSSSSSSSNNNNNSNFGNNMRKIAESKPKFNENNPQFVFLPNIQVAPMGNNQAWFKQQNRQPGSRLTRSNIQNIKNIKASNKRTRLIMPPGSIAARTAGRQMTTTEASLIKKLIQLGGGIKNKGVGKAKDDVGGVSNSFKNFVTLQHSSQFPLPNVLPGNILVSPNNTFFHTNPDWTYHGKLKKTNYQLYIPVNVVQNRGKQSMAYFEPSNNGSKKGFSTIIMPKMKSNVVNVIKKENGSRSIISVYKKPSARDMRQT